jgi:hypothetical protein
VGAVDNDQDPAPIKIEEFDNALADDHFEERRP